MKSTKSTVENNFKNKKNLEDMLLKKRFKPPNILIDSGMLLFLLGVYFAKFLLFKVIILTYISLSIIGLLTLIYHFNKKEFYFCYFLKHSDILLKWTRKKSIRFSNILNFVLGAGMLTLLAFNNMFLFYSFSIYFFMEYIFIDKIIKTASYEYLKMMDGLIKAN
jgi:hypothetical protein